MHQTDQMVSFSSTANIPAANLRGDMELAIREFDNLLHKFCARRTRCAPETAWSVFSAISLSEQREKIESVRKQCEFVQEALINRIDGHDNLAVLRFAISKLGLEMPDELFDRVRHSDLCEIYNENHLQVFRSFNFFDACNYSLLQLVTFPWYELWERPASIERKIAAAANAIFKEESVFENLSDEEPYAIRELQSADPQTAILAERFMARLVSTSTGRPFLLSLHTCDNNCVEGTNLAFI